MTDEQLRAMARRVLGLVAYRSGDQPGGRYYPVVYTIIADEVEAQAVAIMRDEMAKAQAANYADMDRLFPFVPHTDEHPLNSVLDDYVMTDDEAEALLALPVTQSVSIDA